LITDHLWCSLEFS